MSHVLPGHERPLLVSEIFKDMNMIFAVATTRCLVKLWREIKHIKMNSFGGFGGAAPLAGSSNTLS